MSSRTSWVIHEIEALLDLFEDKVSDHETNRLVKNYCENQEKWKEAKNLFHIIRERNIAAGKCNDVVRKRQYSFEEYIAKLLFNLTHPQSPFDPHSPYWIIKNALLLALQLNVQTDKIVKIVTIREEEI